MKSLWFIGLSDPFPDESTWDNQDENLKGSKLLHIQDYIYPSNNIHTA